MNKQGPLTKVEKFYIENNIETDPKDLAKDLSRSIVTVKHYIEDFQEINKPPTGSVTSTKVKDGRGIFGRRKGSVVSTKEASEKGEGLKRFKKNKRDGIYKPFSE